MALVAAKKRSVIKISTNNIANLVLLCTIVRSVPYPLSWKIQDLANGAYLYPLPEDCIFRLEIATFEHGRDFVPMLFVQR